MADLTFEWNDRKAADNLRKHGVSFEEAKSAFLDENARLIVDPEHSDDEDRFILLGVERSTPPTGRRSLLPRERRSDSTDFRP